MPVSLTPTSRLAALAGECFDVIVIGGGIIGAGIARDAAMRGLRVALFEKMISAAAQLPDRRA
jgi:glycerol-3-phosphate dehydrogenase